jgi:hypothetical protein
MGIIGLDEFSSTLDRLGQKFQRAYQSVKDFEELKDDIDKWWLQYHNQFSDYQKPPSYRDIIEIYEKFNSTVDISYKILTFIKTELVYFYNEHAKKYQEFLLQNNFGSWETQLKSLVDNSNNLKKHLHSLVEGMKFSE